MEVISVINNKGGVGKTTTTLHLATRFAKSNKKVLMIDFDPQINLTEGFVPQSWLDKNNYNIMNLMDMEDGFKVYQRSSVRNLMIMQGNEQLNFEKYNINAFSKTLKILQEVLNLDYVFLDCPPTVLIEKSKMLQIPEVAIYSANHILIPINADYYSSTGVLKIIDSISFVEQKYHLPKRKISVFLNRTREKEINFQIYSQLLYNDENIGKLMLKSRIKQSAELERASNENKTIYEYAPNGHTRIEFEKLYKEFKKIHQL